MKTFNIDTIIQRLIEKDIETYSDSLSPSFNELTEILRFGFTGYYNFTERALIEHYLNYVDLDETITLESENGTTVARAVEEAGIEINGTVTDWEYF